MTNAIGRIRSERIRSEGHRSGVPKGQPITAQGNALGNKSFNIPSPERASQSISVWNAPSGLAFIFNPKPRALPWAVMDQAVGLPNHQ